MRPDLHLASNKLLIFIILTAALLLMFVLNLVSGSLMIPVADVFAVLSGHAEGISESTVTIVMDFRFTQAVTAAVSGAGLAIAGLLMQTLFRNPLADPSILGISSGASLGVAILLMLTGSATGSVLVLSGIWGSLGLTTAAFLGAMLVLLVILFTSHRVGHIVSLLIIGIMISYIGGALVGFIKYYSQKEDVYAFVLWGMGSFSNVGKSTLAFYSFSVLGGIAISLLLAKPLNMILLGERYAANLGLSVRRNQWIILFVSGYLTAIITAFAGPIAFIGLAVPHIARNLFRTSEHRLLLPTVVLTGAILALFCNWVARLPGFDGNLPINAVTALLGAPMVIWIIIRRRDTYQNDT
ncbi:MAG: iron ABC transporter permease [Bacteroidetes bacterium]|nr:iron ABC transporter permease [Bacteroidota bacterium]